MVGIVIVAGHLAVLATLIEDAYAFQRPDGQEMVSHLTFPQMEGAGSTDRLKERTSIDKLITLLPRQLVVVAISLAAIPFSTAQMDHSPMPMGEMSGA